MSVSATSSGSLRISRPRASPSGSPPTAELQQLQLQQQQCHEEFSSRAGTYDAIGIASMHSGPTVAHDYVASIRVGSTTSSCEDTGTPLPSTPAAPGVPSEPWLPSLARPQRPSHASSGRVGDGGEASTSLPRSPVALATLNALSAPPAMLQPRGLSEATGIVVDMARRLGAVDGVVPSVRPTSRVGATPRPGTDALSDVAFDALPSASALRAVAAAVLVGYRPVPFHNWRHGFDVAHCAFTLVSSGAAAAAALGPVDRLAALLGALAHDVDHPGHTNGFEVGGVQVARDASDILHHGASLLLLLLQVNSLSDLALTYNNQSVLEHHHAATLFRILLNTPPRSSASSGSRSPERSTQGAVAVSGAPERGWPAQPATDSASGAEPRSIAASAAPPPLLLPGRRRQPPPVHNALGLSRQLFTQVRAALCILNFARLHTRLLCSSGALRSRASLAQTWPVTPRQWTRSERWGAVVRETRAPMSAEMRRAKALQLRRHARLAKAPYFRQRISHPSFCTRQTSPRRSARTLHSRTSGLSAATLNFTLR